MTLITETYQYDLTNEDIDDLLVTAFEGGINYWCDAAIVLNRQVFDDLPSNAISKGYDIELHIIDEDGNGDVDSEKVILTKEKLINGIKKAAAFRHKTVKDFIEDVPDAEDADIVIQFAVFNELVFS